MGCGLHVCFIDPSHVPFQAREQGAVPSSNNSGLDFITKKNVFSAGVSSELSVWVGKAGGHGQELRKQ